MKRSLLILAVAFLVLAVACAGATGTETGIASNLQMATAIAPTGPAQVVTPDELVAAPQVYENELLQVTGQYQRGPVVVCDGLARLSPARWVIAGQPAGEGPPRVAVRGFEELVRPLLPVGMTVTVEGVWRHWRGPVGCGKDAAVEDIWYLALSEFLSPSPIARVTLTPQGQQAPDTVGTPIVEPSPTVESTTTPTSQSASPTPTREAWTPTPSPATATRAPEEDEEDEATPEPEPEENTPTATATDEATEEPDATGTATATATEAAGGTATPTRSVVDKGSIDYQDLRGDFIGSSQTHSWQFQVRAGDVITIQVAARLETDVALTVLDPAGNRVAEQNSSPAGEIEQLAGLEAEGAGTYRVVISEAQHRETDYAMLLLNNNHEDYYNVDFSGVISYGSNRSSDIPADTDQLWFFFGNAGERINVNVSPSGNADMLMILYEPDGSLMVEQIDDAAGGGAEQLLNYQLPATGLFGILVGEYNLEAASYTILVARN